MTNGTLETHEGRPMLRFERRLDHPVERVWRAVTEPEELGQWFVVPVDWTPEVGETFEAMEQRGEITEVDPPRAFGYVWGDDRFRFELSSAGDGCLLVFTHVFSQRDDAGHQAAGWDFHLDRLEALLEGRAIPGEDEMKATVPEGHERYAEAFGIDPEVGRRAMAEHLD